MTKKVIVYGDSFVASDEYQRGWTSIFSKKMGLNMVNHGVCGSSTEYAMEKFLADLQSNFVEDNDIIIFCTSTPGRLNLEFQKYHPETASKFLNTNISFNTKEEKEWYRQNQNYVKWYVLNHNFFEHSINHEAYIHVLRNIAETRPSLTIVLLANSDHCLHIPYTPVRNFLRPNIFLNAISENEVKNYTSYEDWTSVLLWNDPRINHLSLVNQNILVNLLIEAIGSKTVLNITNDKFKKNVFLGPITTKNQYIHAIKDGLITPLGKFVSHFSISKDEL